MSRGGLYDLILKTNNEEHKCEKYKNIIEDISTEHILNFEEYPYMLSENKIIFNLNKNNIHLLYKCFIILPMDNECKISENTTIFLKLNELIINHFNLEHLIIFNKLRNKHTSPYVLDIKPLFNGYKYFPVGSLNSNLQIEIKNIYGNFEKICLRYEGYLINLESYNNLQNFDILIEQAQCQRVNLINEENIFIKESYNILKQDSKHKIFRINDLLNQIYSFLWEKNKKIKKNLIIDINLKNPIKELYWCIKTTDLIGQFEKNIKSSKLLFNQHERFNHSFDFLTILNQHKNYLNFVENVNVYSFSFNPLICDFNLELHTCNFNKIDSVKFEFDIEYSIYKKCEIFIFGINQNKLCCRSNLSPYLFYID